MNTKKRVIGNLKMSDGYLRKCEILKLGSKWTTVRVLEDGFGLKRGDILQWEKKRVIPIFEKGDVVIAKRTIWYAMGQISSDKICRGERCVVDEVDDNEQTITLMNHADRYGPWYMEDFILEKMKTLKKKK